MNRAINLQDNFQILQTIGMARVGLTQSSASQLANGILPKAPIPTRILSALRLLEFPPSGNQIHCFGRNLGCSLVNLPPDDISNEEKAPKILENEDIRLEVRDKRIVAYKYIC